MRERASSEARILFFVSSLCFLPLSVSLIFCFCSSVITLPFRASPIFLFVSSERFLPRSASPIFRLCSSVISLPFRASHILLRVSSLCFLPKFHGIVPLLDALIFLFVSSDNFLPRSASLSLFLVSSVNYHALKGDGFLFHSR